MLGVLLSAVGMFLLVFGIQEGESYKWGTVTRAHHRLGSDHRGHRGAGGLRHLAAASNNGEPLLPLDLFKDRNFTLANLGITLWASPSAP